MKYTIDTTNKTISLDESVSLKELILELQANLKDWEDYTILYPNTIQYYAYYPAYPNYYKNPYEVGDINVGGVIPTTSSGTVNYPVPNSTPNYTIEKLS